MRIKKISIMKLDLYNVKDNKIIKEFSIEESEKINDIVNTFILNSKMKWGFEIIKRNYITLFQQADSEFKYLIKNGDNWEFLELTTLEINRNVLNYLASLNAFIDQSLKFVSGKFGKNSDEMACLKSKQSEIFDNHFSYRFLYNLRNNTLHQGYTLCAIDIKENENNKTYIPKFIYDDLMKGQWQKDVKKDLENIGEDFKAFDVFTESLKIYEELSGFIVKEFIEQEEVELKKQLIKLLNIETDEMRNLRILITDEGENKKIAEIPFHYFI